MCPLSLGQLQLTEQGRESKNSSSQPVGHDSLGVEGPFHRVSQDPWET